MKLSLCLIKYHAKKTYGGVEVWPHALISVLDGGVWSTPSPRPLYPRYKLEKRQGGPQSQSGRGGEEKKIPAGNRTPFVQPIA